MTILDALNTVDSASALTTSRASTDTIDLGISRDVGGAQRLWLNFLFTTLPTAAGAATVRVAIQTSADNATWVTLAQSDDMPIANFTAQAQGGGIRLVMPSRTLRYVRCFYTVTTGPLTAGAVSAQFCLDRDLPAYYPRNYAV